ncbi:MAG: AAA family ATPase [Prevotella sp.]|nr:AAA family ATPase [Prevotella sp.]
MDREGLIETRDDVIKNIKTLYSYLRNRDNDESYQWAIERMKKGKNYVVEIINGHICFAPSRFVGYKDNTKEKHEENHGQGTTTDDELENFYQKIQDKRLDLLFQKELSHFGLTSGNKKYWIPINVSVEDLTKNISSMQKNINLLISNKNLILTGAPGTGKTFMAKAIAEEMNAEVGFVQFHPSYDYTDFVEGLRPITKKDGQIGFERKDGVFKVFCKKANSKPSEVNKIKETSNYKFSIEIAYEQLVEDLKKSKETIHFKTPTGIPFGVKVDSNSRLIIAYGKYAGAHLSEKMVVGFNNHTQPGSYYKSHCNEVIKYLKQNYKSSQFKEENPLEQRTFISSEKKYIFIIDEINRGEISKIFGELFFSIDPGYRGEKGRVQTQYQNMIENDDVFKDGFYIPENVYIIGTMNDIDRSVESMDFAMRRRFAWQEVTADESYYNMIEDDADYAEVKDEIKQRMFNLNKAIAETEGLNEAYQIGAAYFRKVLDYINEEQPFVCLWNNHLKGLLFEYLRGNRKAKELLEKLYKAYNMTVADE